MRDRRPEPPRRQVAEPRPGLPFGFRLRHLLAFAGVALTVAQLAPRGQAAWNLRERATELADYALCMAGPTGPALLRDDPAGFQDLVRRRLLVSEPEETPFADCASLATAASGSAAVGPVHEVPADQFVEYGGSAADQIRAGTGQLGQAVMTLEQLGVTTQPLAELAEAAWPFERQGYQRLIRASQHRREATHPADFPHAGVGSGLPAHPVLYRASWFQEGRWTLAYGHAANLALYQSVDNGMKWQSVPLAQPGVAEHAGRCAADDAKEGFTFEADEGGLWVRSWLSDRVQHSVRLEGDHRVVATSCDRQTALVALEDEQQRRFLMACRHAGACGAVPALARWLRGGFDIARVQSITVLATMDHGLVRVRSSRDDGRTWTPATIAYDWKTSGLDGSTPMPTRLLKMGKRLLLYGESNAAGGYPLVFSDDYGASWRGPDASHLTATGLVSQR